MTSCPFGHGAPCRGPVASLPPPPGGLSAQRRFYGGHGGGRLHPLRAAANVNAIARGAAARWVMAAEKNPSNLTRVMPAQGSGSSAPRP
jgi:hypothetical protein